MTMYFGEISLKREIKVGDLVVSLDEDPGYYHMFDVGVVKAIDARVMRVLWNNSPNPDDADWWIAHNNVMHIDDFLEKYDHAE